MIEPEIKGTANDLYRITKKGEIELVDSLKRQNMGRVILEWLRRSPFMQNALGTYGNLGRNTFEGPGTPRWTSAWRRISA
jgi:hypothetical protein